MASAVAKAKGGFEQDPTRFAYKLNAKGTFTAVLRLLPAPDNEIGFAKVMWHKFKDRAGRDINIACPKMDGKQCPICGYVQNLYNIGSEASKKIGQKYNSSKTYYANVLVKTNNDAPETVGKVMVLAYKREINKIITAALEGDVDASIEPINVFDYFGGADLVFRAVQKGEYPTYVNSKFESVSALDEATAQKCDQAIMPVGKFLDDAKAKIKPLTDILEIFRKSTGTDISEYADMQGQPTVADEGSEGTDGVAEAGDLAGDEDAGDVSPSGDDLASDAGASESDAGDAPTGEAETPEVVAPKATPKATAPKATPKATATTTAPKAGKSTPNSKEGKDAGFWAGFDSE